MMTVIENELADRRRGARLFKWLAQNWDILLLVLAPIAMLLVNPSCMDNPDWSIDPWLYHGFFRWPHRYLHDFFPGTYYGTRLPWILPGALCFALFPPRIADWVLHFALFYSAAFSLRFLLRAVADRRTAVLVALLGLANFYFYSAWAWDYVTGPGLTLCIVTLALLTSADKRGIGITRLILAGGCWYAMVACHLTLLIVSPWLLAQFIWFGRGTAREWGFLPLLRALLKFTLGFLVGTALVQLILGLIDVRLGAGFWFLMPQIRAAFLVANDTRWKDSTYSWLWHADWLVFQFSVLIGSLLFLARLPGKRRWAEAFLPILFITMTAFFIVLEAKGQFLLQYNYYACYLLPFLYLALSVLFRVPEGMKNRLFFGVLAVSVFLTLLPFANIHVFWVSLGKYDANVVQCGVGLLAATVAVIARVMFSKSVLTYSASVLLLGVAGMAAGMGR